MKPDVIVTWPKNCDYPIWREFIRKNRGFFNSVIVVFMDPHTGFDYSNFIVESMYGDNVQFMYSPNIPGGDWRDVSINHAFSRVTSPWVWFTEQDFITNRKFLKTVGELSEKTDFQYFGIMQGDKRLHPACLFITKFAVLRTRMNFGIVPGKLDHFGLIQQDLEKEGIMGLILKDGFEHLNGLSHNFRLISENTMPNYNVERFKKYGRDSLKCNVPIHPEYKRVWKQFLNEQS